MIPTETIEDIKPVDCKHRKVIRYGKDYYNCCECGMKIDVTNIKENYEQVR